MMRIALVSCVKSKRAVASPARELYTSRLFTGLRAIAESTADEWFILSAEHGLVEPSQILEPYERTLNTVTRRWRKAWAASVYAQLNGRLAVDTIVDVYAGERYREFLVPWLVERGHVVNVPLEGMSFGKQLQYLAWRAGGAR